MGEDVKPSRGKKLFKFIFLKFPIFVMIFIAVMIAALKLVERYPDPLREGFEQYLSQGTLTNATIGKLDKFAFFPNIDVRLRKVTFHNRSNAAEIDLEIDYAEVSAPLWSIFTGNNRLKNLDIQKLDAKEDVITPQALYIEKAGIVNKQGPDQYGSFITAEGLYNKQQMFFEAEVEKRGTNYYVPKEVSFTLSLGDAALDATLSKGLLDVSLKNTVFTLAGKKSAAQDYILVKAGEYNKNNPLTCLYEKADIQDCKIYLEDGVLPQ